MNTSYYQECDFHLSRLLRETLKLVSNFDLSSHLNPFLLDVHMIRSYKTYPEAKEAGLNSQASVLHQPLYLLVLSICLSVLYPYRLVLAIVV